MRLDKGFYLVKGLLVSLLMSIPALSVAQNYTAAGKIVDTIMHYPDAKITYAVNNAGWGHPGCPNAQYATFVHPSTPDSGYNFLLVQLSLSHNTESPIVLYGTCSATPNYLENITFVIVD